MSITVPLALFGWIPASLCVFAILPPGRAAVVSFVFAWMFLPATGYDLAGLPDYTKASAAAYGVLLGTLVYCPMRVLRFRPSLIDLPMVIWCFCPFASSITNGLGVYDGASAAIGHVITWGLPYYLGRIHLRDAAGIREIGFWLFVGGLIYVPLCWFEIRMSPQLNGWVYGFGGGGTEYASELGKWGSRPRVFMGTGLTVGMFMTAASLVAFWLWDRGQIRRLWGTSVGWLVSLLIITSVMCKNMGALVLLLVGVMVLLTVKRLRTRFAVWALILAAPLYMLVRSTGDWSGQSMVGLASAIHQRRGESLQFRLDNEDMLVAKALQRPLFGWGGWGRARVWKEDWRGELKDVSVTDGLWVIAFGNTGITGLVAVTSIFLVPSLCVARRYSAREWLHPAVASVTVLAVLLSLYTVDNLFNAMFNPVYVVAAGALSGFLADSPESRRAALYAGKRPVPDRHPTLYMIKPDKVV